MTLLKLCFDGAVIFVPNKRICYPDEFWRELSNLLICATKQEQLAGGAILINRKLAARRNRGRCADRGELSTMIIKISVVAQLKLVPPRYGDAAKSKA